MARPLWKGAITFGLVSIPIEVHTAVRDRQLRFHLLTAKDRARVKYERVSEKTHKPVAWDDLVKGYEYAKGRYVVLTPEDFEAAALEKTRTIDILDFVKAEEIDDRFFEKPYYVTPGAGGDRAYVLLRETIRETERIGIAKFVLRERQHLAALEVIDDALVLTTLRFADELIPASEYDFPASKGLRAPELKTARMLVEELASEWDAGKVHGRLSPESSPDHQGQTEGSRGAAGGRARRAYGQRRRSDGAAPQEPRRNWRTDVGPQSRWPEDECRQGCRREETQADRNGPPEGQVHVAELQGAPPPSIDTGGAQVRHAR